MRRIQFYKEANSSCANHALLALASNCLTVAQENVFLHFAASHVANLSNTSSDATPASEH